jgi:hypothetical protein
MHRVRAVRRAYGGVRPYAGWSILTPAETAEIAESSQPIEIIDDEVALQKPALTAETCRVGLGRLSGSRTNHGHFSLVFRPIVVRLSDKSTLTITNEEILISRTDLERFVRRVQHTRNELPTFWPLLSTGCRQQLSLYTASRIESKAWQSFVEG